jgi:hypothetical protein
MAVSWLSGHLETPWQTDAIRDLIDVSAMRTVEQFLRASAQDGQQGRCVVRQ